MAQGFEVFRMEKLKTEGAVVRSLRHDLDMKYENEQGETVYYRKTRDDELSKKNQYWGKTKADAPVSQEELYQQALKRWRGKLPEKRRKNAVVGAQCIFTFSHELLEDKKFKYGNYFVDCQKFVNKHFGEENVFNWALHMDEKTPHISFQFVPKDEKGNLNARKIFGNKKTLSEWQDKFHEEVGQKYGLKRGIKKTNIIHQTLNRFYGQLKNLDEDLDNLELPKKELFTDWEDYFVEVKNQLKTFVEPMLKPVANLRKEIAKFEKMQENFENEKADFYTEQDTKNKALDDDRKALERAKQEFEEKVQSAVEERLVSEFANLKQDLERLYVPKDLKFSKGDKVVNFYKKPYEVLAKELADFYLDDEPNVHKRKREIEREFSRSKVIVH